MKKMEELIDVLEEINKLASKDGAVIWFPRFVPQNEMDVSGWTKQPSDSGYFEYEYVKQSAGVSGDNFHGEIIYPFEDWFIVVQFEC